MVGYLQSPGSLLSMGWGEALFLPTINFYENRLSVLVLFDFQFDMA